MVHIKLLNSAFGSELPEAVVGEFDTDFPPYSNKDSIIFKGKEYDISHITFDYDNNVIEIIVIKS